MAGIKIVFADTENRKIDDVYFISIQYIFNYFKNKNPQMLIDMTEMAEKYQKLIKIAE